MKVSNDSCGSFKIKWDNALDYSVIIFILKYLPGKQDL